MLCVTVVGMHVVGIVVVGMVFCPHGGGGCAWALRWWLWVHRTFDVGGYGYIVHLMLVVMVTSYI